VGPMVPPAARSVPVGPFGFLFSPQMSVQSTGGGTPRGSLSSSSSSSSACVGGPAVVPVSGVPLPRVLSVAALLATRQPIPLGALFSEFGGASFDFLIQRGVSLYGMGNVGPRAGEAAAAAVALDPSSRVDRGGVDAAVFAVRRDGLQSVLSMMSDALRPVSYGSFHLLKLSPRG
jgi:hypothetical protein